MEAKLPLIALLAACSSPEQKSEESIAAAYEKIPDTIMAIWQPIQYARLREASPDQNFGGQSLYLGASADGVETALVQYNAGRFKEMNVEKAVLQFSAGQTCHSSYLVTFPKCGLDLVVEAHAIQQPWEQNNVTWASFHETAEPYNALILGTAWVQVPKGKHNQYALDITAAVQDWISGKPNDGIAIIADKIGQRKGRFEQTDTVLDYAPELVVYTR